MRAASQRLANTIYIANARKTRPKTMADATGFGQDAITEDEITGTAVPASSNSDGTQYPTVKTSNACK